MPCVVFSPFPCFHFLTIFHRIPMDLGRDWWLQIIARYHIRSENPSIIDSYDIYGHIRPKSIILLLLRTPIRTLLLFTSFPGCTHRTATWKAVSPSNPIRSFRKCQWLLDCSGRSTLKLHHGEVVFLGCFPYDNVNCTVVFTINMYCKKKFV